MKHFLILMTLFGMINPASNTESTVPTNLYDISIESIDGEQMDLSQFKGKKILFVNVASKCGFTPQYEDLEKLSKTYEEELVVIGIPCNQFGNQEPGSPIEIQEFCQVNFGVTFPLTAKVDVKGKQQHPLYTWLTEKQYNGVKSSSVKWNFQKYLVDEKGQLIDFFGSTTNPMSKKITSYLN